jgi:SNF2 family DNA or RNA helicase
MTSGPALNDKENRILDKLQFTPGLVLAHGLGTGKTRTSIQVANQLNMPTDVVVPASLQDNYKKELNKWLGGQPPNIQIESQQAAGRNGLKYNNNGLLIVDEAHRARDSKSQLLAALKKSKAQKRLMLTATPAYNHPSDIAPLVNLAANKPLLPETRQAFSEKYIGEKVTKPSFMGRLMGVKPGVEQILKKDHSLTSALKKYVDYEPGSTEGFPSSREEQVKVPITKNQQDIYNTIMGKAPAWVRWKVRSGLPPGKGELQALQAFLTGARQAANSNWDFLKDKSKFDAPKAQAAATFLRDQISQNPNYKGVVYSNYLGSGLAPYKSYLDEYQIPYGEFSGQVAPSVRNQLVRDYNANKIKALLISSAGAEGLDLKGTRVLQILEPHFNREKEKQVIGRAIRYKSHEALPPEEQNVTIQRYLAQPTANWFDRLFGKETVRGTDEYISDIADRKERLNQQLIQMLARGR